MNEFISALLADVSSTLIAGCAVFIAKSLHDLNLKIAVVIERVDSHERRLNKLEDLEA